MMIMDDLMRQVIGVSYSNILFVVCLFYIDNWNFVGAMVTEMYSNSYQHKWEELINHSPVVLQQYIVLKYIYFL